MTDKYYYEHQAPEPEWLKWYNNHESKNMKEHQRQLI